MMKKLMTTAAALVMTAATFAVPNTAEARGGRIVAGVIGGLAAGAIIGGALAQPYYDPYYPTYYYGPGPYYYGPGCYWHRVWTPIGWRRERVCY